MILTAVLDQSGQHINTRHLTEDMATLFSESGGPPLLPQGPPQGSLEGGGGGSPTLVVDCSSNDDALENNNLARKTLESPEGVVTPASPIHEGPASHQPGSPHVSSPMGGEPTLVTPPGPVVTMLQTQTLASHMATNSPLRAALTGRPPAQISAQLPPTVGHV